MKLGEAETSMDAKKDEVSEEDLAWVVVVVVAAGCYARGFTTRDETAIRILEAQ